MNYEIKDDTLIFECGCKFPVLDHKIGESNGLPSIDIDFYDLELNCPETWKIFAESTKGVFQLETQLGNTWSKKLKPDKMEHLAALGSILRPGVLKAIVDNKSVTQHYIDRKNGVEDVKLEHDSLEEILKDTYGLSIYQEQTLQIAQKLAGFDLKQADILRRAIGKKIPELMTQVEKEFLEGIKKVGLISEELGRHIWDNIRKSERYSFNKSHSVSYGYLGYISAYIKYHFPLEFYTAWLSFAKYKIEGKQEIKDLVRDAKHRNININNPSIKHLASDFSLCNKQIFFGLSNIKGIGESQFTKLLEKINEVQDKLNKNIKDFSWYEVSIHLLPKLSKTVVNALISAGAFDCFRQDRRKMLYDYSIINQFTDKELEQIKLGTGSLLENIKQIKVSKIRQKTVNGLIYAIENPSTSLEDNILWINKTEEDLLGIPLSVSKLDTVDVQADTTCQEFLEGKQGNISLCVEVVQAKEVTMKKGNNIGGKMAFLSVEDSSALIDNIAVFADNWENYKNILYKGNTVVLRGYRSKKDSLVITSASQI